MIGPSRAPRTTKWLCGSIVRSAPSPVSRHHRWLRDAEIPATDRSRWEHQVLSEILEKAVEYDALQVSNLASFEVLSRRVQHIEQAHIDCPTAPDYAGGEFFMGSCERKGGALVAPNLALHVAGKFRDDASIQKEQRKAREVRGASSPSTASPPTAAVPGKGKGKPGKGKADKKGAAPGAPAP